MKEIFAPSGTIKSQITYFHLLGFCVTLPFDRFYSELILISLLIHTLITFEKSSLKGIPPRIFLIPVLFAIGVISLLYSDYQSGGLKDCEKQLALIIFPLILVLSKFDFNAYRRPLLLAFAITNVITIAYLFWNSFKIIYFNGAPIRSLFSPLFTNQNFTSPLKLHATYFSMFIALSIPTFIYEIIDAEFRTKKIIFSFAVLLCLAGLFQLSSRSVFVALFIIINLVLPFSSSGTLRKKMLLISLTTSVLAIFIILKIDSFTNRFIVDLQTDLSTNSYENQILEPRAERWKSVWDVIIRSPLIGHGNGSESPLLREEYFKNRQYSSFLNNLNSHNQFLSYFLKAGIFGILYYCGLLIWSFIDGFRKRDQIYLSCLIIITAVSFAENILDVNKGIFFFSCFLTLFINSPSYHHRISKQTF